MTKSDIVGIISKRLGSSRKETEAVINAFIDTIIKTVKHRDSIEIRGFGSFNSRKKLSRMARNPRTGEPVMIPERYIPVFKASKEFRKIVEND